MAGRVSKETGWVFFGKLLANTRERSLTTASTALEPPLLFQPAWSLSRAAEEQLVSYHVSVMLAGTPYRIVSYRILYID